MASNMKAWAAGNGVVLPMSEAPAGADNAAPSDPGAAPVSAPALGKSILRATFCGGKQILGST